MNEIAIAMCAVALGVAIGLYPVERKKPFLQRMVEWLETKRTTANMGCEYDA